MAEHLIAVHLPRRGGIFLRPGTHTFAVCDHSDKVLAAASYSGNEVVAAELVYRRRDAPRGSGRVALAAVIAAARQLPECTAVILQVRRDNVRAARLYESLGFAAFHEARMTRMCLLGKAAMAQALATVAAQLS